VYYREKFREKLKRIYPDLGKWGIDIEVEYDEAEQIWIVDLKKGATELRTHLELEEAKSCMEGKRCVSFGLQIAELKAR
jgi:hypothetical protein